MSDLLTVRMTGVLLFGYLLMSRTFAHWGLPPVYIGEAALGAYLLAKPASLAQPWLTSLARPSEWSALGWWLAISLTYGVLESFFALLSGSWALAAEVFVFHLYPFYVFPGLWVGTRYPNFLPRVIPALAWCHGIYGLVYITVLSPLGLIQTLDDPQVVGWFGHPSGSAILLLALLAYERNTWRASIPLLLNTIVLLGMQRRAEWIALLVAVTLWSCLAGRLKQLFVFGLIAAMLLLIGLLPDVRFPSPGLRGEALSTRDVVGRVIAPFSPETARNLTPDADFHVGTAIWRSEFWGEIWHEVHATPSRALFGLGYDYHIWELHTEILEDNPIRTPHSIVIFVLGYSGWIGMLIFLGLQGSLARLLWLTYRKTGAPFGICLWTLAIVWALVDPLLERPIGAIPLYLLMGLAAAQAYTTKTSPGVRAPDPPGALPETLEPGPSIS